MGVPKSFSKGFAIGLVLAMALLFAFNILFMQRLVSWIDPVLKDARVLPGASIHSDGVGSFYLHLEKRREGFPEYYAFFFVNSLNQASTLDAYKAEPRSCEESPRHSKMTVHDVGTSWVQHYCFQLPLHVDPASGFKVIGEASHKAWPWLTSVVKKLPSFTPAYVDRPYHNSFGELE